MFQLSRSHHTVDFQTMQPGCELSQLCGAFQGVCLVHYSLHAHTLPHGLSTVSCNRGA